MKNLIDIICSCFQYVIVSCSHFWRIVYSCRSNPFVRFSVTICGVLTYMRSQSLVTFGKTVMQETGGDIPDVSEALRRVTRGVVPDMNKRFGDEGEADSRRIATVQLFIVNCMSRRTQDGALLEAHYRGIRSLFMSNCRVRG